MVFPDSVRFALLSRGSFFVCLIELIAKRLGGAGEIIKIKQVKAVKIRFIACSFFMNYLHGKTYYTFLTTWQEKR